MEDDDDLASILDGEEPLKVSPTSGFHPDQLTADPVMRISPRLYAIRIDGVSRNNSSNDYILVDSKEMEAYSRNYTPNAWEFEASEMYYAIRSDKQSTPRPLERSDNDHSVVRGEGVLEYRDFDRYELGETGEMPSTVLSIGRNSDYGIGEIARKAEENGEAFVEIKPMV